jgi:ABC-2 type transport system permease protein
MSYALRAEWTKLRTVSGTAWLLLAVIAATILLGLVADALANCPSGGCHLDPARTSLTGIYLSQAVVAVLAALTIGSEYSGGMIRQTLVATPRRTTMLAAKAVVLTALVLATGTIAVLGSVLVGGIILPAHGFTSGHGYLPLTLRDGPVLRAATGSVLYLVLITLLSLGIATAVRDAAAGIGGVLGLLYLIPIIAGVASPHWQRHLHQFAPMTAGLAIQATTGLRNMSISPWGGLGVLAAWAAASLFAAVLMLRLRDA